MKTIQSCFVGAVMIAACALTVSTPAFGDTYQVFPLWIDAGISFYSMDDSGNVALIRPGGFPGVDAYYTFHYGVPTALFTPIVPTFMDDQGTSCTPAVPSGGYVLGGVCNNGRDVFTGALSGGQVFPGLYSGSFPDIDTIVASRFGGDGGLYMNSNGDIVIDDIYTENWYFFLDTSTSVPEPGSIILVGTGALTMLGAIRRRVRQEFGED